MDPHQYVEVVLGLPLRQTFHYRLPRDIQPAPAIGKRVRVPFGPRDLLGYVVSFVDQPEVDKIKPVRMVLDEHPVLGADLLKLTRWMAEYYQTGWGEAIEAALPGPLRRGKTLMKSRIEEAALPVVPSEPFRLTEEQQKALDQILPAIQKSTPQVFLLYGVTGSGKTEVYLQAIQQVIASGKSSIVLVPEIALTPQAIQRFQGRFGVSQVAVLHSRMLESKRLAEWYRIQRGEAQVVVGTRSAVFAPTPRLGLIVIDEEHEPSYKQDDAPRYHAREVAIRRGELTGAPVILGSATPALESYFAATQKRFHLLELRERIERVPLPEVQIVDMREEISLGRRNRIFSRALEETLTGTLRQKQQVLLFLNRRGFSTFIHCPSCGFVMRCKACQVTMTYHMETKSAICHYCHRTESVPEHCPKCRAQYVRFQGFGTERVESEVSRLFPEAAVGRMDTDATKMRGSHAKILQEFQDHQLDVLVGTQMIAKGLDVHKVTLVGVISADTALNQPDFRSAERTFNLLTQVAGRAGRGKMPGRVIVQTYTPHHYAIQAAQQHHYENFYQKELGIRKELKLPPFTRVIQLTVRSTNQNNASQYAQYVADLCRRNLPPEVETLGPAPSPIPKIRRQYRWQVVLKTPLTQETIPLAHWFSKKRPPRGTYLAIDVDPL